MSLEDIEVNEPTLLPPTTVVIKYGILCNVCVCFASKFCFHIVRSRGLECEVIIKLEDCTQDILLCTTR